MAENPRPGQLPTASRQSPVKDSCKVAVTAFGWSMEVSRENPNTAPELSRRGILPARLWNTSGDIADVPHINDGTMNEVLKFKK